MSAWKTAAEKTALADLPRGAGVSRVKDRLRIAARNSVCPIKEDGSKRVLHAAGDALPHRPSVGGTSESIPGLQLRRPDYHQKSTQRAKCLLFPTEAAPTSLRHRCFSKSCRHRRLQKRFLNRADRRRSNCSLFPNSQRTIDQRQSGPSRKRFLTLEELFFA